MSGTVLVAMPLPCLCHTKGVCYIRTSRQDNAVIYNSSEDFHVGQAKVGQPG